MKHLFKKETPSVFLKMAHHVQIHTSHILEGIDIRNSELKHKELLHSAESII
jgi:hypothetical protein